MTQVKISADRFGPWALVTGASSGIGREFAGNWRRTASTSSSRAACPTR
ncbi:hypothetical protein ACQP0I_19285 [Micromonospora carbonacea]